jgi:hypothetical protein
MSLLITNQLTYNPKVSRVLADHARAYCDSTTIHGFKYWVNAPRDAEKLFWVIVVLSGFVCASLIINTAVEDWIAHPGLVTINSFSTVT